VYDIGKQAVGGFWLNPREGEAMTITLSDFEFIILILTIIWIYVTWKQGNEK